MGLALTSPEGVSFRFDPGALCLEFAVTGGPGAFARHEQLHEPADLQRWADASRLPPGLELSVTQADLAAARALRDAVLVLAAERAHDTPLNPRDLTVVNGLAERPALTSRIDPDGTRAWSPDATGARLLATVARDAVDLFTGPYGDRVRECGAHDCYLLFVDVSRPGRRRWCSMERCGNRSKVRSHRTRRQAAEGAEVAGAAAVFTEHATQGGRPDAGRPREERSSAMSPTGMTQDAGWQIGVSRTLPYPPEVVWDFVASPEGIALWLGEGAELPAAPRKGTRFTTAAGESGELRSYRAEDRIRATLGPTTVQVSVSPAPGSDGTRAVLRFHQEKLSSAHERERQREHWQQAMDRAAAALE